MIAAVRSPLVGTTSRRFAAVVVTPARGRRLRVVAHLRDGRRDGGIVRATPQGWHWLVEPALPSTAESRVVRAAIEAAWWLVDAPPIPICQCCGAANIYTPRPCGPCAACAEACS